jgi:hypothetical protein
MPASAAIDFEHEEPVETVKYLTGHSICVNRDRCK